MQLGFVGLGKMGGEHGPPHPSRLGARVRRVRLLRGGGERGRGPRRHRRGARSRTWSRSSSRRARCGSWSRRATRRRSTVDQLAELLDDGDTIVDGGNSRWTDDKRRQEELREHGIHYVDVGTSGGVWGLSVGYCMMVGGPDEAVERLSPILDVLAPPATEEHGPGWGHFGPTGAGHYVKMVHNGDRVRDDAGLRRGLRAVRLVRVRARQREDRPPVDAGLGRALVAVRARRARVRAGGQRPRLDRAVRRGLRRGPLDGRGRDRQARADAGDHRVAVRALHARADRASSRRR